MLERWTNLFKFRIEQFLLRGMHARLAFIATVIVVVSLLGGILVHRIDPAFATQDEGIWWAFLRLTDPGYLGDDEGAGRRALSTVVTVLGYVLFMGALVAIMTQWLHQTIRRLESGYTPLAASGHIVLVGWSTSTPDILREILGSSPGRVRRFLSRRHARRLHLVLLIEEFEPELIYEIRAQLGPLYRRARITPRSGDALRLEHLRRVDFLHASAIVIPADAPDEEGVASDVRAIKTLLAIGTHGRKSDEETLPYVVVELHDPQSELAARAAYPGELEIVTTDRLMAKLFLKSMLQPGLGSIYEDLFQHGERNAVYVRELPELIGEPFAALRPRFPHAIPFGIVRRDERGMTCHLAPRGRVQIREGDRVVMLAEDHADTEPRRAAVEGKRKRSTIPPPAPPVLPPRRLLVLGWNAKIARLVEELSEYQDESLTVDVLSVVPAGERAEDSARARVRVRHLEGDYAIAGGLAAVDPPSYDTIVLAGSELLESGADTDARTIVGYLLLRDAIAGATKRPHVIVELLDPANQTLIEDEPVEILVSSTIVGQILAHVTLRAELRVVYDTLFGAGGADLLFRAQEDYLGPIAHTVDFEEAASRVAASGDVLLGYREVAHDAAHAALGMLRLNPPQNEPIPEDASLVVVATRRSPEASGVHDAADDAVVDDAVDAAVDAGTRAPQTPT